jgi:hypothetical protein
MGLPALLLPETWAATVSLPPVDPVARGRLRAEVNHLLADVRRVRPAEGTPQETAALVRVSLLGLATLRLLGSQFLKALRPGVNHALEDLVRKELVAAEPERKLALRHVEQAVHRYGVLIESLGASLSGLPDLSLAPLLDELADQVKAGEVPVGEAERIVLRFQLNLLVALDVLDAPLDELTFWAYRAITDARRVEAMPAPVMPSGLRGELARIRAKRAWLSWDAEEASKELAPWPSPSR